MANPLDLVLKLTADTTGFNSPMDAAKSAVLALTAALAAIGLGLSAKEFIDLSDATQQMNTRLRGATEGVEEYNKVQSRLLELANATYRPLEEAQEVYLATNGAMKALGYSTEEILSVTESLSLAFTRNGTAADVAQSAQDALTGALVKGRVDADAWASIMRATPNIAEDLAKQTGKTTAEILKLGASGSLAVRDLSDTLIVTRDANLSFANAMDTSTKDAIQVVRNGIRALVSDLNEQYNISSRLAEVIQSLGGDMSWITVLFDDAMSAIEALSDRFNSIDPSVFESLKQAVSAAYDAVKELAIGLYELGGVIDDAVMDSINNTLSILSSFTGGVSEAGEQVSFLTRIGQGLSVTFGAISDVLYAARIAVIQTAAVYYDLAASANAASAAVTWGETSKQFTANADAMSAKAESYYSKAQDLANNWEYQTIKQLDRAVESEADKNARILVENKKALDELLALGEEEGVNNEKLQSRKLSAIQKYAQDAVAANGGVLDSTLELELATKGYFVTVDKDGKAAVTRLTEQEQATAAATLEVKKQEVAFDQAKETGKAFGLDIEAATNKVSTGFNDTGSKLAALVLQLKAAGVDGEIAGEQIYKAWLKWLSQAKSTAEIDLAKQKLMELGVSGQVTGEQLNAGFKLAEKAASDLNPALTAARLAGKELGIDIDKTSNVMSAGFAANIEKLGALSKKLNDTGIAGQEAANTVYAGWQAVLAQADSPVELEALKIKLQELGNKGELSAKQVEMGLIDVERKLGEVNAAVSPVEQAFHRLGIQTKEQLRLAAESAIADFATIAASGQATAADLQKAYERNIQAAIASGDAGVIAAAKAQAAQAGLTVKIDKTGKVSTKTFEEFAFGSDKATKATDRLSNSFDRAGQSGTRAARATSDAWDNTVTSLTKAAAKLDEITRKQGGTTGSDFLNGGKDTRFSGNSFNLPSYSQDQIAQKLMSELGYDKQKANLKAKDIFNDQTWSRGGASISNGQLGISSFGEMSNGNYVDMLVNKLAGISSGTTGQAPKTVRYDLNMGNQQTTLYGEQGSEAQTDAFLRQLETLKKGM